MYKKILIYLLFIAFAFLPNTKTSAQKIIKFTLDDFPETIEIKGEKLAVNKSLRNPYLIQLIDSLLIINNINTTPAFDLINKNNGKLIGNFCNRGRGPGESIGPDSFQYIKESNEIMVHDAQMRKLFFYNLDSILNNSPKTHTKVVNIDQKVLVRKIQQVKNGNFFCDLIGHADGYMNCLIDKNGNFIKFLNKYPKLSRPFNPFVGSNLFPTAIGVSPNKEWVILPYTHSDIIEIFDFEGNYTLKLIGPNYKKLDVFYSENRESRTDRNNIAFHTPCAGNNSFMVVYTGVPYRSASNPGEHILHFGMDGTLIKHFKVSPAVSQIAVDWDKKTIYGINKEMEPTIYKYKF